MEQILGLIRGLSDTEFAGLRYRMIELKREREELKKKREGQAELLAELRDSGHIETPVEPETPGAVEDFPEWVNPVTDHSRMCLLGDRRAHNGRVWRSTFPTANPYEPGGEGVYADAWVDITDDVFPPKAEEPVEPVDGEPVEPAKPVEVIPEFKAGLNVQAGDRLMFNGATYEVVQGHTTQDGWTPPAVPALFRKV